MKADYLWSKFNRVWKFKSLKDVTKKESSLAWALFKAFWPWILWGCVLEIVFTIFMYFPPLLMELIINFIANDDHVWRGYLYCVAIVISNLLSNIAGNHSFYKIYNAGCQIKSAIIGAVYRKCLLMSSDTRKNYPSGNIINLVSVDAERIMYFLTFSAVLIGAPFRIIIALCLLWKYLGPASLAGAGVLAFMIPINLFISKRSESFYVKQMELKDIRLKNMSEILNGIKILKLYAWEIPFMNKITEIRKTETKYVLYSLLYFVIVGFIFVLSPFMITLTSFAIYLFVEQKHVLDPTTAFVSLNLANSLQHALFEIPDCLAQLIQTNISLGRLREFFQTEEQEKCITGDTPNKGEVLTIKEGTFTWSKEGDPVLSDIELHIPKGKLIGVMGSVGSGKSSLLSAILGDMYKQSGTIDIKGSLAYVPQQAWVLNRTVKENILLVRPMKENIYNKIIECCCLKPDFDILPASDNTEIGEKGVNISGGQKQRISLARAVYQDADIYLLDDPLSAVDAHVRKSLFDDIVGHTGMLKRKTRILVTHDVSILPNVDLVISIKDGRIDEIGTYKQLMNLNGSFAEFIREHANKNNESLIEQKSPVSRMVSVDSQTSRKSYERSISTDSAKTHTHILQRRDSSLDKVDRSRLVEEEKMEVGGVKKGVYLNYIKHLGFYLIPGLIGYMAYEAFQIGGNIWLSKWSSDKLSPNMTENISLRNERLTVYGLFGLAQGIGIILATSSFYIGSNRASKIYHKDMLLSVMRSPMSFFDTTPIGRILNRFGSDIDVIDMEIIQQAEGWVYCLLGTIATFIVIGMNTPIFLAAILPIGIAYYFLQKIYLNASRQIKRLESTSKSPIYSHFMETIQGLSSLKAFDIEKEFIEKLENKVDDHISCHFNSGSCNRWLGILLDLLGSLIVFAAITLAIENRHLLAASVVGLVISYALTITESLMWLVRTNTEMENNSISVERIDEYCKLPSEAPWDIQDSKPPKEWPFGKILFENYSTKYREELDLVLKNIHLDISPSEKVGIVGRTGAGKSSVTLALFRIIEAIGGKIVIDNIDVSKIGLHALRSKLTIIPQDPVLFTGTLRMNLDPNDDYTDAELWKSLEQAHLKDFVSKLDKSLEYDISEGGENLSVGQRQLICLARALLKRTKILILDEATAAVDMETDNLIQKSIRTEFHDHTVITIAHRLNTIIDYDKIVVMDKGHIVEVGNPNALLKDNESKFYHMAKDAGLI